MTLEILLVAALVATAVFTVMTARLLWSVIALASTSATLTIIMFHLNAPLAGVFELSVCAGLIPAIFISTIGLTQRLNPQELSAKRKELLKRMWFLPLIIVIAAMVLTQVHLPVNVAAPTADKDVRDVLWNQRHLDLLGQIVILLAGAFGVVVLIKGSKNE
jgi:NADH-quinone oxidoreductase subunit J